MIEINVKADIAAATEFLNDMQRSQVPFAAALALTRTGKKLSTNLAGELRSKLESPSPYTLRSTFSTVSTKVNLSTTVGIKDMKPAGGTAPAVLLKEHFGGGLRGHKPMEKALAQMGDLPAGWRVVPGAGMPLDAYGNPKRTAVRELLGALRAGTQVYKGRGKKVALVGYFVIKVGARSNMHPGVYWRKGRAIRPMFLFIAQAGYRKRVDLPRMGQYTVARDFQNEFRQALSNAITTAR